MISFRKACAFLAGSWAVVASSTAPALLAARPPVAFRDDDAGALCLPQFRDGAAFATAHALLGFLLTALLAKFFNRSASEKATDATVSRAE